jgi:hypothetical protein
MEMDLNVDGLLDLLLCLIHYGFNKKIGSDFRARWDGDGF